MLCCGLYKPLKVKRRYFFSSTPRKTSLTSLRAAETSETRASPFPQPNPEVPLATLVNSEHSYNCDSHSLKIKYDEVKTKLEATKQELHNTKRREKCARLSVEALLTEVKEIWVLSDEAHRLPESYKDIPVHLFTPPEP
ncbi:uncharacterized protein LOC111085812 [Limulus polyphemus]|uniref:Uncharacterized protein LOC111085812 n=1 Tax=Limulus polyphemus TaxID=6850 RepID=A0ABM1SDX0_LIMPO|nr:uncharacterized protein LOC111085812 [Limulus polyphemus]